MIKRAVGWVVSWLLYWIGDFVSDVMNVFGWSGLYGLYNWLMIKSGDVQMWSGCEGPWIIEEVRVEDGHCR